MTPEQGIKREVKRWLESHGAYWCMVQGGAFSKPGDPDIVACVKGRFVAVEAKSSSGRRSEAQEICARRVAEAGGLAVLARSAEDVERALAGAGLLRCHALRRGRRRAGECRHVGIDARYAGAGAQGDAGLPTFTPPKPLPFAFSYSERFASTIGFK